MEQENSKKITTVNLPADLIDFVKEAAKENHRSFTGQVAFFLEQAQLRHNQMSLELEEEA